MYDLIDYTALVEIVKQFFMAFINLGFTKGLILGASLELLGYGIFKAVSLLNINY